MTIDHYAAFFLLLHLVVVVLLWREQWPASAAAVSEWFAFFAFLFCSGSVVLVVIRRRFVFFPGSIFCWCCVVVSCFAMTKEILFISCQCGVGVGKMKVSRLLVKTCYYLWVQFLFLEYCCRSFFGLATTKRLMRAVQKWFFVVTIRFCILFVPGEWRNDLFLLVSRSSGLLLSPSLFGVCLFCSSRANEKLLFCLISLFSKRACVCKAAGPAGALILFWFQLLFLNCHLLKLL